MPLKSSPVLSSHKAIPLVYRLLSTLYYRGHSYLTVQLSDNDNAFAVLPERKNKYFLSGVAAKSPLVDFMAETLVSKRKTTRVADQRCFGILAYKRSCAINARISDWFWKQVTPKYIVMCLLCSDKLKIPIFACESALMTERYYMKY